MCGIWLISAAHRC